MISIDPPHPKLATLDDLVDAMYRHLSILCATMDLAYEMQDMDRYLKLLSVYGRCITSLGSLLRTQKALGPPAPDFLDLLGQAVDELAVEQGWTSLLPGSPLIR